MAVQDAAVPVTGMQGQWEGMDGVRLCVLERDVLKQWHRLLKQPLGGLQDARVSMSTFYRLPMAGDVCQDVVEVVCTSDNYAEQAGLCVLHDKECRPESSCGFVYMKDVRIASNLSLAGDGVDIRDGVRSIG